MKKLLVLTVSLLLLIASTQAAIASTGMGGRAMAMGGAFTAVADDGTAAYWNPAGLTQLKFGLTPTFGGLGDWNGITDLINKMEKLESPDSFNELGELSIKKTGVLVNMGAGLNFRGFGLNIYTEPNIDTDGLSGKTGDLNGNVPVVVSLSLAREFSDLIGVGVNVKSVSLARATAEYKMEAVQLEYKGNTTTVTAPNGSVKYGIGTGFALDLGGLFKVSDRIRVGAMLRNLSLGGIELKGQSNRTDLNYLQNLLDEAESPAELEAAIEGGMDVMLTTEDYTEAYQLPTVLTLGGAVKLPVTRTLIAADYEIPFSDQAKSSLHVGVEQPIFGIIFLRAGGYTADDGFRVTGGLGGKIGPLLLDLAAVKGQEHSGYFLTGGLKF
jgi:long-subunit fatty acid transport protein